MDARDVISVLAVYVFAYYGIARWALRLYVRESTLLEDDLRIGMATSSKLLAMISDPKLPGAGHSKRFRVLLLIARCMLLASPFVALALVMV
jgi:hypothetical protein